MAVGYNTTNGMKKILLALVALCALNACDNKKVDPRDGQIDSLGRALTQQEQEMTEMMTLLSDIQMGFNEINEAEGRINLSKANPEANAKAQIQENLAFIKEKMNQNRALIEKLQAQIKSGKANGSKLQASLDNLTKQYEAKVAEIQALQAELERKNVYIAEQDKQIVALNTDVENLNTNVNKLSDENKQQSNTITHQDRELNTAWYVFGTKKELKEQGILQNGEVLQNNNYNKDYFTRIDIRTDKTIKLYARQAELLTTHPAGSYTWEEDANKERTLQITNPQAFWSVSKYLVIRVK